MKKYLFLIIILLVTSSLFCFIKELDFTFSSGFTTSSISGKTIKISERGGYKYRADNGIQYGASAIYKKFDSFDIEGGLRYIEKGYQIYSLHHYHHYHHRHHYRFHRRRHEMFYDEFKSSYLDLFVRIKPDFGDGLEMHDLNIKLKPFLGLAYSHLLNSEDENINDWDATMSLGCEIIFSNRFILGLEYNKGMTNIFYDGRANTESFSTTFGILF